MNEITCVGSVPQRIMLKAEAIMKKKVSRTDGWRKILSHTGLFSFRLDNNYRMLRSANGSVIIGHHDVYTRKIKTLKKRRDKHGYCL